MRDLVAVISAHQLSRSHRAILLLANGEHTLPDLARLSARPVEEVVALVQELEEHGLVYYY
jgi:DNA-binding IclR family transcriptional regulator